MYDDMSIVETVTKRTISNDLVGAYARWLEKHVDLHGNAPDAAAGRGGDRVAPTRFVREHLEQRRRLQYRCRRAPAVQVVTIRFHSTGDRDDDVLELSDHLVAYFPGAYREVSACHTGLDACLLVDPGQCPRAFAGLLAAVGEALSAIADDHNFRATVTLHGPDSPAAAPSLPRREQDLASLVSSPVFTTDDLRRVLEEAPDEAWLAEGQGRPVRLAA